MRQATTAATIASTIAGVTAGLTAGSTAGITATTTTSTSTITITITSINTIAIAITIAIGDSRKASMMRNATAAIAVSRQRARESKRGVGNAGDDGRDSGGKGMGDRGGGRALQRVKARIGRGREVEKGLPVVEAKALQRVDANEGEKMAL